MFTYHDSVHPGMRLLSEKPICLEPCADYRGRMGSSTGVPRAFSFFFFFFFRKRCLRSYNTLFTYTNYRRLRVRRLVRQLHQAR